MENKQFPEQEDQDLLSEEILEEPVVEVLNMEPVKEETPFQDTPAEDAAQEAAVPAAEENPEKTFVEEIPLEVIPEEAEIEDEVSAAAETAVEAPVLEDISQEEPAPRRSGADFMASIPDVEDDAPVHELLSTPDTHPEITADHHAMDYQGMLGHGEEEPEFDLSILDDPEFAVPHPPEAPQEDVSDQEYRDNGRDMAAPQTSPVKKEPLPFQIPIRKGRPKRKKGEGLLGIPNILVTFVWLALILAIGVTLGRMLWVCAADVLAFGREDKPVTITIYEADSMEDIVDKLHKAGLIRYKSLFTLYADISDAEEDIQPGIYDLNTRYDYHALVNFMSPRSSREVIELTIPEGYTCRQIFALLEENRICTAVDAASYAANGELNDYWFLEGVERGSEYCLEGFLFPDTYEFYKNSTPREALQKMLNNFENRFDDEMRAQLDVLNASLTGNYTVREIAIVASLIEKESAAPAESANIAGVIYNRLFRWEYPALLNIDAAIVYAQGGDAEKIDTKLDSPYNTYTHTGLTPTPIANPGLASLKAALYPTNHKYYFYVLNPSTGMHQFSSTQAEHDRWIAEFYG